LDGVAQSIDLVFRGRCGGRQRRVWRGFDYAELWWVARDWPGWVRDGSLSGALLGYLVWLLRAPSRRTSRTASALLAINGAAWAAFLLFAPPLTAQEWSGVVQRRAVRDTSTGLELISHAPVIVAGRWHSAYPGVSDKMLAIMAEPAILVATHYIVPSKSAGEPAMERESYLIAEVAGLLSSTWWLAFGNTATSFVTYLRRHRPGRI
jgi:hypothetical protein